MFLAPMPWAASKHFGLAPTMRKRVTVCDMNLDETQTKAVAGWIDEGLKLFEIQRNSKQSLVCV